MSIYTFELMHLFRCVRHACSNMNLRLNHATLLNLFDLLNPDLNKPNRSLIPMPGGSRKGYRLLTETKRCLTRQDMILDHLNLRKQCLISKE